MAGRERSLLRWLLALAMITVGVAHFVMPAPFVRIVPAALPHPLLLVYLSGAAEIAGGLGLLAPWAGVRRAAAWGLVALYIAVFPANLNQAWNGVQFEGGRPIAAWILWARLPFQALFIYWAWQYTRRR